MSGDADDEAAQHGAGDRADAAENGRDERLQARHGAEQRLDVDDLLRIEHSAHRRQTAADGEGDRDDLVVVDAHQLSRALILRDGAHGLAGARLFDEEVQADHQRDGDDGREHLEQLDRLAANLEQHDARDDIREFELAAAEDQLNGDLQRHGNADGRDQRGNTGRVAQRLIGDLVHHDAQHNAEHNACQNCQRDGDGGVRLRQRGNHAGRHNPVDDIGADHHNVAMGKVDELDNAVNHRVAQCDQCINAAHLQAADQILQDQLHILPPERLFPCITTGKEKRRLLFPH